MLWYLHVVEEKEEEEFFVVCVHHWYIITNVLEIRKKTIIYKAFFI